MTKQERIEQRNARYFALQRRQEYLSAQIAHEEERQNLSCQVAWGAAGLCVLPWFLAQPAAGILFIFCALNAACQFLRYQRVRREKEILQKTQKALSWQMMAEREHVQKEIEIENEILRRTEHLSETAREQEICAALKKHRILQTHQPWAVFEKNCDILISRGLESGRD